MRRLFSNFIFRNPCPLLILPSSFTRSDKPISYAYTDKRYGEKRTELDDEGTIHRRLRIERGRPLTRHDFNLIDDLPTEPDEYFLKQKAIRLTVYSALEEEYKVIKKVSSVARSFLETMNKGFRD